MSKRFSKDDEARLLDALDKASSLMSTGVLPSDAVTKIAGDAKLPPKHIQLMVNAINTGLTNAHRQSTDDPMEKAADFPIADAKVVLAKLYPDQVKTAAGEAHSSAVSNEYFRPPTWVKEQELAKAAGRKVDWKLTDKKPDPLPRDETFIFKQAMARLEGKARKIDNIRMELVATRNEAIKLASDLTDYFCQLGNQSFKRVKETASLLFGTPAEVILNKIANSLPKQALEKYSSVTHDYRKRPIDQPPYNLIHKCIKTAAAFDRLHGEYEADKKALKKEAEDVLAQYLPKPIAGNSVLDEPPTLVEKHALFGDMIRNAVGVINAANLAKSVARGVPGYHYPEAEQSQKDLERLLDPAHEAEIRTIQAEAMLNDLMSNDDVLRGYQADEVIDAYNEISQSFPLASTKKPIVRDLLRKRLAGGAQALDQFALSDLAKTERELKQLGEPSEGSISILRSTGVLPNVPGKPPATGSVLG